MHHRGLLLPMVTILLFLPRAAQPADAPQAILTEEIHDFGTVRQGERVVHAFTVRNTGSAPLRMEQADLSMPGMKVRFPPNVQPGGEGTVTLEWATDHVVGTVTGEAHIRWNDPGGREGTVKLTGVVTPPISIQPIPAVFLSVFTEEPGERILTVVNNEERPLAVTGVESGPHVTAALATAEPGKIFKVSVRPAAGVAPGRYEELLTLHTDNTTAARVELPVHLFVKADLYADPDSVDFGTLRLQEARQVGGAESLAQTLLVKRREGSFTITSIASDLPAVAVTRHPEGPSESFKIDVRLRPETLGPGKLDGKIRISTSDPRFPELVVPVRGEVL